MAESIECIITIRAEDDVTDTGGAKAASGANGDKVTTEGESKKQAKKAKAVAVAGYHYAKRAAMTVADYNISTVALRTGQERLQEKLEFNKRVASFGISLVEGAVGGMVMTGGNPAGALIGAAVTTAFKVAELGIEQSKFNMQRTVDDIGLAQANIRAGAGSDRIGKNTY